MKPLVLLVTLSIPMRARAPLSLGGVRHETGLAAFAGSETEFDLKGLHQKFTALVGADNRSADHATVDFVVLGDGRELWRRAHPDTAPDAIDIAERRAPIRRGFR